MEGFRQMKLISEWKKIYKYISVQIPALNVAFLGTWALLPQKFQDALPVPWVIAIAILLLVAGVFGRIIAQPSLRAEREGDDHIKLIKKPIKATFPKLEAKDEKQP